MMSFEGYIAAPPTMTVFSCALAPVARTDNAAHVMMNRRNILTSLLVCMSFSSDYASPQASDCVNLELEQRTPDPEPRVRVSVQA
jgi:hypothetical protein